MESESGQSDITSSDPTKRIIKFFSKCLFELMKHAESIQYKNNKLVNYDVSSTLTYDSCNEIDITEHNIKTETKREGPIFKEIEKIKQYIVELLTICSQQNISINYDTTRPHVAIYDSFDDPQRILVMNHLTLHVISMVENIYMAIKFFKSAKYFDNGQQIKKSFSNIYKEIKNLPTRPDIVENMDSSFKSLTHKSEYKDSYDYLVDKLNILCKSICKFNKTYRKKCGYNDSTDDDNSPKKKIQSKIIEETYVKPENDCINGNKEAESVFKIPETVEYNSPNTGNSTLKQSDENRKKAKRKINTDAVQESNENMTERDSLLNELLNDTINEQNINSDIKKRSKKKKKTKSNPEQETNGSSCYNLEKELNELINNTANNTNKNQNVNTENNVCENDKTENKKKRKNEKENLNNSKQGLDSVEKTDKKVGQKKEKLEVTKKRKINNKNFENEQLIKRRKLEDRLNNTATNTNPPNTTEKKNKESVKINPEEKCDVMSSDELSFLEKHFNNDDDFERSNDNAKNDDNFEDEDKIPDDELNATSSGNIEIDRNNDEFNEFVKVIKDNNLNEHEKFLYVQVLLDAANAKVAMSEEKKEALKNLNILIDWEVCPVHLASTNITLGPSEQEKQELERLGVTSGQYSAKEDEIMKKNWKEFCKKHDLDEDPIPFMNMIIDKEKVLSNVERKKFLQFIGRGLPHKSLHSIFRRFKCLFKPKVKYGRFSPEEDELILIYCNKIKRAEHRKKYIRLVPLIKRDRSQIERRYRVLKKAAAEPPKRILWPLDLQETFLKHLLEETQSESVEDLRDKHIDYDVFMLISKMMNIPATKLKVHWLYRLYTELFAADPINTDLIKIKLIKKFKELEYDDWKTVNWQPILPLFVGCSKGYLWLTLKNIIRDVVPPKNQKNLKACIDMLYEDILPTIEERVKNGKDTITSRLRFENGKLVQYK